MKKFLTLILAVIWMMPQTGYADPPPVEAYAQLPAVYDGALSPDGQFLAAILENDGQYIVRVFNIADSSDKTMRATALPRDAQVKEIRWANNDRILIRLGTTQLLNMGLSSTIVDTGFILTLPKSLKSADILIKPKRNRKGNSRIGGDQSGPRQFNDDVIDYLPSDPKHILMSFSDEKVFAPDVQKVNVKSGTYKKIRSGSLSIQEWITDLRGEVRVGQGRANIGDDFVLSIRDADSDDWKSAKEYPGLEASDVIAGFMENPNEMIVARYGNADTLGLFIYDLRQKKYTRKLFQHDAYDVYDLVLSPDGRKVIGAEYIADSIETVFFDPEAKNRMDTIREKITGYTLRFIDQTSNGDKVLLKAFAPDLPASLILYDFTSGKWMNMGSDYPLLSGVPQGHVQSIKYTARDGQTIPGYVTLPQKVIETGDIKNLPFVIMPHGGPYARDTASFDYKAQLLASRGYGVLQMNFRGSEGYGREFEQAGRQSWIVMQEDVTDGAKWLVEKGYADKDRICIMGWSYGGYAALMGAVKHSDMYKCAVSIAGVTDLGALIEDQEKYRFGDRFAKRFIKEGFKSGSQMKEYSPVKQADAISIPVFLAHGTKDVNVHFAHFQAMKKALRNHKDVTAVELEGSAHSIMDSENRIKMFSELDKFLVKHLGESEFALD